MAGVLLLPLLILAAVQPLTARGCIDIDREEGVVLEGRRVHVQGPGFAAHTGHHRAPLVVDVNEIRVEGR